MLEMHEGSGIPEDGEFLLLDKPLDWTSFDVVAKVRNTYKRGGLKRKVGHSGTLDPKATGLLILATGKKTRELSSLEGLDKVYDAVIRLGARTLSHDSESEEYGLTDASHLDEDKVRRAARDMEGVSMQQAPMHSATWHKGKRLYELARKGEVVEERKSKEIVVHSFEILRVDLPLVYCRIHVSKGAYIRVLADELGEALGVGGYLAGLRRVAIGPYRVESAMRVDDAVARVLRQMQVTDQ
ncbi:MAG: tRNA pseudouridine(55) synthase TruB [Chlorobium sp.]|nr:tRNA pseudouridine(55) synthase TruB [Chlorobium phaeovibrioides]NQU45497.1 tRNA pseudouridine(55) synthase TruB [Chlorobium sp.]